MNIVVVGGGTAGWLTSLMVKAYHPSINITVVESEEIGILGAGEGTTNYFVQCLDRLNIPTSDLIKHCKATFKLGINFENWNGDNKSYFHAFSSERAVNENDKFLFTKCVTEGISTDLISLQKKLCDQNKVPFYHVLNNNLLNDNPINSFNQIAGWALHFDARELAKYLRKVAESRDIKRIEGKVTGFIRNGEEVSTVVLEDGTKVEADFIFDCSGFARLLIGKEFGTEWISYEDYLPLDTAIPFFIEHDDNVSPRTDAIAMKNGWIWKIPVQGRYGCGYVFDSSYIDEEQALKEAENYFGRKLTSPKTFRFKPGSFKETVVANCMAVGLSQSFVEPLEATSIWVSLINLDSFLNTGGIYNKTKIYRKKINEYCLLNNNHVLDFLRLHYITKREDSLFWKEFQDKNKITESLEEKLINLNSYENCFFTHEYNIFVKTSWLQVSSGLGLLSDKNYKIHYEKIIDKQRVMLEYLNLLQNQENMIKTCVSHKEFLDYMRQF
jgi:tryptophan halogenase